MTQTNKGPRRVEAARGQKMTRAGRASVNNKHSRPATEPTDWYEVAKARYPRAQITGDCGRFAVVITEFDDPIIILHKTRSLAEDEMVPTSGGWPYEMPVWIPSYEIVDLAERPKEEQWAT
jgi:hypothetical protein